MRSNVMFDVSGGMAISVNSIIDVDILARVVANVCAVTITALEFIPVLSLSEKAFGVDWDT